MSFWGTIISGDVIDELFGEETILSELAKGTSLDTCSCSIVELFRGI